MVYHFGDFELDTGRFVLRRAGRPVPLQPLVFELLTYLVKEHHRLVTKEELFERLWNGAEVSDSALNRAIYAARRALGDDSKRPVFIATHHGRGYRFVAPVEELPDGAETGERLAALVGGGPEGDAAVTGEDEGDGLENLRSRPRPWWRSSLTRSATVVLLVVMVAGIFSAIRRHDEATHEVSPARPLRVVVLPVTLAEERDELEILTLAATHLLTLYLDSMPDLALVWPWEVERVSSPESNLTGIARRAGAEHLLVGWVTATPDSHGARLSAALHTLSEDSQASRRQELAPVNLPTLGSDTDLHTLRLALGATVREIASALKIEEPPQFPPSLAPRRLEAYQLYLLADRWLAQPGCEGSAVLEVLERSVELDPGFAPAWTALARLHYHLASRCLFGRRHYEEARSAAEHALRLYEASVKAAVVLAWVRLETNQLAAALKGVQRMEMLRPGHPALQCARARVLVYAGLVEAAAPLAARCVAERPLDLLSAALPFEAVLPPARLQGVARRITPGVSPRTAFALAWARAMTGDYGEMETLLAPVVARSPADVFSRLGKALLALSEGDAVAARSIAGALTAERRAMGAGDGEVDYRIAQICSLAGDGPAAVEELRRAVELGFFCGPCFLRDPALEAARGEATFLEVVALANSRTQALGREIPVPGGRNTGTRSNRAKAGG